MGSNHRVRRRTNGNPFNYQTQTNGLQITETGMPWGASSKEVRTSLIKFNQEKLIQDLDRLDGLIKESSKEVKTSYNLAKLQKLLEWFSIIIQSISKE